MATLAFVTKVTDKAAGDEALIKLGDAIRAQRLRAGMSQEALAFAAEVNRTHIGEVERGKRNVSFLAVLRIAQAMQVCPSQLIADAGL